MHNYNKKKRFIKKLFLFFFLLSQGLPTRDLMLLIEAEKAWIGAAPTALSLSSTVLHVQVLSCLGKSLSLFPWSMIHDEQLDPWQWQCPHGVRSITLAFDYSPGFHEFWCISPDQNFNISVQFWNPDVFRYSHLSMSCWVGMLCLRLGLFLV